jgi:DNA-binding transcriptional MerR regulator
MSQYLTTGQVARKLRISISTLKRWLESKHLQRTEYRNCHGWRLFTEDDIEFLKKFKRQSKKNGKCFKETTLLPVICQEPKKEE